MKLELTKDAEKEESFDATKLIGLTVDEAAEILKPAGHIIRITRKDGHAAIVTRDYRLDRLNVSVREGKIVDVLNVG